MTIEATHLATDTQRRPITGPTVWDRDSLQAEDYVLAVEPAQADACLRLRDDLRRAGRTIATVEPADFQVPELAELGRAVRRRILAGPGFGVLSGLPLAGWTDEEASMLYWGLGTYLGTPQPQNLFGDRVYLVADTGKAITEARGSKTNSELIFHTDGASGYLNSRVDVLGLLCLRKAVSGGESRMISSHTAYNRLLEKHPDLVEILYEPFCFDRSRETAPGGDPISVGSVFTDTPDGVRVRYNRAYIELGHMRAERPLTDRQRDALTTFDNVLNDPSLSVEFTLEPGDVFLASDHATMHNRRAFVDAENVADRRALVRLWLEGEPRN